MPPKIDEIGGTILDHGTYIPKGKTGPLTFNDLTDEHREVYEKAMTLLQEKLIKHFMWTHSSNIRCIGYPKLALDGINISTPSKQHNQALGEEMNTMIHHALLRQAKVVLNSMDNIVARVVKAVRVGEHTQDVGPSLSPHIGEKRFYSWPIGTKVEFIVYAPQDLNDRPTCYEEPPAYIPKAISVNIDTRLLREGEEPYNRSPPAKQSAHTGHIGVGKDKAIDNELGEWQARYGSGPV
ncbi:hypothetical protein U9M48_039294 [Paspalum notatum var. saurae]|uniref:Uncharacterized protein n=1 Tax=Paspalum notatum var. saurae TaxID=547442 RepID=A0AAQ3UNN8_PASNO